MLTADQLDALVGPIVDLYEEYQVSVIRDIARRLAGMNFAKPTAAWQMQRLTESGRVYERALEELAGIDGRSAAILHKMFEAAGVKAMRFDDAIYREAGLNPLPLNLSPAMASVLAAGLRKTQGLARNLTLSTAAAGQDAFIQAADLAYMQISSGALDYQTALRRAVKGVADQGLEVIHFSGRHDQLDVAMRRTVLTGINQTVGQLQTTRADQLGVDLVQTSAHAGARNTGTGPANHEGWQGRVFSRSGANREYPGFVASTGYGTAAGLMGVNCRHSWYPFFPGISENAYSQAELDRFARKRVTYQGREMSFYEATQAQRGIERKIRKAKREAGAVEAAGLDASAEKAKVRALQGEMRGFVRQTGLKRQGVREQVYKSAPTELIDPDLRKAQQGSLFDLESQETEVLFSKHIDLTERYGNDRLRANEIIFESKEKGHTWWTHPSDREWLRQNQDLVLKAIQNPLYVDTVPRPAERNGFNVAHIVYIGEQEYPFLNVVINFRAGRAKIWTMFRAPGRFVISGDGQVSRRWKKAK